MLLLIWIKVTALRAIEETISFNVPCTYACMCVCVRERKGEEGGREREGGNREEHKYQCQQQQQIPLPPLTHLCCGKTGMTLPSAEAWGWSPAWLLSGQQLDQRPVWRCRVWKGCKLCQCCWTEPFARFDEYSPLSSWGNQSWWQIWCPQHLKQDTDEQL